MICAGTMRLRMNRVTVVALLTLPFAVLSCKSEEVTSVAKSTPMTLTIEPATASFVGTRLSDGNLRCPVDWTVLAHGTSDHYLTMQSISAGFTVAGVSNTPAMIAPTSWFGLSSLKRTESAVAHRIPTAPSPFVVVVTVTYVDQFGTAKSVTSSVTCTD